MKQKKRLIKPGSLTTHGKTCPNCKKKQMLTEYYNNSQNIEWELKDKWCKSCVKKFVVDIETLQVYCRYNNRVFAEELYQAAEIYVDDKLRSDEEYAKIKDLDKKRQQRFTYIFSYYTKHMNLSQYYRFESNNFDIEDTVKNMEKIVCENNIQAQKKRLEQDGERYWDDTWFGEYSKRELDFLNDYYNKISFGFEENDIQQVVTAREIAKAALDMMLARQTDNVAKYEKARDSFMKLSESGKFSANKRAGDKSVADCFGIFIKQVDFTGATMRKVKIPDDDIDKVSKDFRHIMNSFMGENLQKDVKSE